MQFINKYACIALSALALVACQGEQKLEHFDNKAYIPGTSMVAETIIKGNMGVVSKAFNVSLARPADQEIKVSYKIDPSKLATYNKAYYAQAELLPADNYNAPVQAKATIAKGTTLSSPIAIEFKALEQLDRSKQYVLPVSIQPDKACLLKSASVYYYVFKAGALINVVADISANHLSIDWKKPDSFRSMEQLTMEALVRIKDYDRLIRTVMGIEHSFLVRIGDAGIEKNQVQVVANSNFKFPDRDAKKGLPTNTWVHIAVTYDSTEGKVMVYIDGKLQSQGSMRAGRVNLYDSEFYIGKSYNDERDLNGEISEARIWNVVRTQEQIAKNIYGVDPASEGLIAYWKFDDENTRTIKDHTANGNNAIAKVKDIKWNPVSLPVQ